MPVIAQSPADLLQSWIDLGHTGSKVDAYIDRSIRNGDRSWYTDVRNSKGVDAAEAQLTDWIAGRQLHAIADGIRAVARGMQAIAAVERTDRWAPESHVVDVSRDNYFPCGFRHLAEPAQMVIVFNPELPGCGCSQPRGSELFSPYGLLGPKAITLSTGKSWRTGGVEAELGVVLPYRMKGAADSDFVVANFDSTGHMDVHLLQPQFRNEGPLRTSLGLLPAHQMIAMMTSSGGNPDSKLGPGCSDLLKRELVNLGMYLIDAADKLSDAHSH